MPTGIGGEKLWLSPTVANNVNPFDDQSGQGNNGTGQGGISTIADTGSGGSYCYEFDGTDDYIDTSSVLGLGSGDWSFSFWAKTSSSSAGTMFSTYNQSNGKWFAAEINGDVNGGADVGTVRAGIDDDTTKKVTTSYTATYNDGTWRHFIVERNNTDQKLRVREGGTSVSTVSIGSYGSLTSTIPLRIGANGTVGGGFLNGQLDDIRFYNRLLTQAEITHLATSRGVLGPPGGATHYNPFKSHAFTNDSQQRLR